MPKRTLRRKMRAKKMQNVQYSVQSPIAVQNNILKGMNFSELKDLAAHERDEEQKKYLNGRADAAEQINDRINEAKQPLLVGTSPETDTENGLKLKKVIVDKVEDVKPEPGQEFKTSENGSWSCAMNLLLKSRGLDMDQEIIRGYRPQTYSGSTEDSLGQDVEHSLMEYANLVTDVLPNTGLHAVGFPAAKENGPDQRTGLMEDQLKKALKKSPVAISNGSHTITAVKMGENANHEIGFYYEDSMHQQEQGSRHFVTLKDFLSAEPPVNGAENANAKAWGGKKGFTMNWLEDFTLEQSQMDAEPKCEAMNQFHFNVKKNGEIERMPENNSAEADTARLVGINQYKLDKKIDPKFFDCHTNNQNGIALQEMVYVPNKLLPGKAMTSKEMEIFGEFEEDKIPSENFEGRMQAKSAYEGKNYKVYDGVRIGTGVNEVSHEMLNTMDPQKFKELAQKYENKDKHMQDYLLARADAAEKINHRAELANKPVIVMKEGKAPERKLRKAIVDKVSDIVPSGDGFQTSNNGCWSCAMNLLLKSRGLDMDQEIIRGYRPSGYTGKDFNEDTGKEMMENAGLITAVLPNTALHTRVLERESDIEFQIGENKKDRANQNIQYGTPAAEREKLFKANLKAALDKKCPVALGNGVHTITAMEMATVNGEEGFYFEDSIAHQEPGSRHFVSFKKYLSTPCTGRGVTDPDARQWGGKGSVTMTWLEDLTLNDEKKCPELEGYGFKCANGKVSYVEDNENNKDVRKTQLGLDDLNKKLDPNYFAAKNYEDPASKLKLPEMIYVPKEILPGKELTIQELNLMNVADKEIKDREVKGAENQEAANQQDKEKEQKPEKKQYDKNTKYFMEDYKNQRNKADEFLDIFAYEGFQKKCKSASYGHKLENVARQLSMIQSLNDEYNRQLTSPDGSNFDFEENEQKIKSCFGVIQQDLDVYLKGCDDNRATSSLYRKALSLKNSIDNYQKDLQETEDEIKGCKDFLGEVGELTFADDFKLDDEIAKAEKEQKGLNVELRNAENVANAASLKLKEYQIGVQERKIYQLNQDNIKSLEEAEKQRQQIFDTLADYKDLPGEVDNLRKEVKELEGKLFNNAALDEFDEYNAAKKELEDYDKKNDMDVIFGDKIKPEDLAGIENSIFDQDIKALYEGRKHIVSSLMEENNILPLPVFEGENLKEYTNYFKKAGEDIENYKAGMNLSVKYTDKTGAEKTKTYSYGDFINLLDENNKLKENANLEPEEKVAIDHMLLHDANVKSGIYKYKKAENAIKAVKEAQENLEMDKDFMLATKREELYRGFVEELGNKQKLENRIKLVDKLQAEKDKIFKKAYNMNLLTKDGLVSEYKANFEEYSQKLKQLKEKEGVYHNILEGRQQGVGNVQGLKELDQKIEGLKNSIESYNQKENNRPELKKLEEENMKAAKDKISAEEKLKNINEKLDDLKTQKKNKAEEFDKLQADKNQKTNDQVNKVVDRRWKKIGSKSWEFWDHAMRLNRLDHMFSSKEFDKMREQVNNIFAKAQTEVVDEYNGMGEKIGEKEVSRYTDKNRQMKRSDPYMKYLKSEDYEKDLDELQASCQAYLEKLAREDNAKREAGRLKRTWNWTKKPMKKSQDCRKEAAEELLAFCNEMKDELQRTKPEAVEEIKKDLAGKCKAIKDAGKAYEVHKEIKEEKKKVAEGKKVMDVNKKSASNGNSINLTGPSQGRGLGGRNI